MPENPDERNLRAAERAHDLVNDLGKRLADASVKDAQEAIKIALLVNSGAAVAILAFISGISGRTGTTLSDLKSITNCLYYFTVGTILAGITSAFAYLSNSLYAAHLFEQDKIWEHPYVKETRNQRRNSGGPGSLIGWVSSSRGPR